MRRAAFALVAINLVRFAFSFTFGLVPQEAYYFLYSRHLALSYFDHPPAIAILIRLFTAVFGHRELALRMTAFTLGLATQLLWLRLARRFLREREWTAAALVFVTTGMVTVTSLVSTPDVPLLFFWTLALDRLACAIFEGQRGAWLPAGLMMGLAFDSKYTAVFLPAGLLLFLLLARRDLLATPWPWLSAFVALVATAPVLIWNARHGWVSFLFQTADRAHALAGLQLRWFAALLGTQSALLLPPLLVALVLGALRVVFMMGAPGARRAEPRAVFLACFFVPPAAVFVGLSFFTLVKPNWLMPCYLSGVLLAAPLLGRAWKWNVALAALLHVLAAVELIAYVVPIRSLDTWFGWRELAAEVQRARSSHPGAFVFSTDQYKTSAELAFYLDDTVYGPDVVGQRGLQFAYLGTDLRALRGRDALYVQGAPRDTGEAEAAAAPDLGGHFASLEQLHPVTIRHGGRVAAKFHLWLCHDYRP